MARLEFKRLLDVLATLKSFEVLDTMRISESDMPKATFRTMYYRYKAEGALQATFSIVSVPQSDDYIVTRTA